MEKAGNVSSAISIKGFEEETDERRGKGIFNELHGAYMWLFHYMPIGRDFSVELQPTPEQRKKLFFKQKQWIHEGYFLVDFWNDGFITDSCISAGRPGGYFYIDWDGNVMPCVFVPYSTHNVKDVFEKGGDLNDILHKRVAEKLQLRS